MFVKVDWEERDLPPFLLPSSLAWVNPKGNVLEFHWETMDPQIWIHSFELGLQAALLSSESFPTWHDITGMERVGNRPATDATQMDAVSFVFQSILLSFHFAFSILTLV